MYRLVIRHELHVSYYAENPCSCTNIMYSRPALLLSCQPSQA
jgi:hypothetical protein